MSARRETRKDSVVSQTEWSLGRAIDALEAHYGRPTPPPTADPFGLVLWENVAYLASPARRREAFELLERTVGTDPAAIRRATKRDLERVTARGILKSAFAAKLRECARIAVEELGGDLEAVVRKPVDAATRALRVFPGIGEPGAEKILLFSGRRALLAPESNGVRVLVRLGLVEEGKSYAQTYAASRAVAKGLRGGARRMQVAHLLLKQHGHELCKRGAPRCDACPLSLGCAHAGARGGRRRPLA